MHCPGHRWNYLYWFKNCLHLVSYIRSPNLFSTKAALSLEDWRGRDYSIILVSSCIYEWDFYIKALTKTRAEPAYLYLQLWRVLRTMGLLTCLILLLSWLDLSLGIDIRLTLASHPVIFIVIKNEKLYRINITNSPLYVQFGICFLATIP